LGTGDFPPESLISNLLIKELIVTFSQSHPFNSLTQLP
jgi:hypothetical protein